MEQHDERLWELEICKCDDGDILLEQGVCWSCSESLQIRLHRSQIPLIAELVGLVPAGDVARATERLEDRLKLLVSLIRAHCKPHEPLRMIVEDLLMSLGEKPVQGQLVLPST